MSFDVVLEAEDGPAALSILDGHPDIDLLLTDVVMPGGMGGHELARKALERRPDLKVLFTSGYTEKAIVHGGVLDEGVEILPAELRRGDVCLSIGAGDVFRLTPRLERHLAAREESS